MFFNTPPILGSVHKISLCQSPAQPPGLLPATQHPQPDPQPNFSLGSRQFSLGTIVHLKHLTQNVHFLHFISVLFLFSLAVGLVSSYFGGSSGWYKCGQCATRGQRIPAEDPFHLSLSLFTSFPSCSSFNNFCFYLLFSLSFPLFNLKNSFKKSFFNKFFQHHSHS
jgi:hypothetical protein